MNCIQVIAHGCPNSFARRVQHNPQIAVDLLDCLKRIAFSPVGHAESSDRQVLDEITRMARDAVKQAGV